MIKIQENGNVLDELKKLDDVVLAIGIQGEKLDAELESLNTLKTEIAQMGVSQRQKMDELIAAVQNMSVEVTMPHAAKQTSPMKISRPVKYLLITFVGLGTIVFFLALLFLILSIFNSMVLDNRFLWWFQES